jgi:hypothetical protein
LRRKICARAVAFFTNHEEQAEVPYSIAEQAFGGNDHTGDDAFGVAGAAAPDEFVVFARGDEGRDRIHVGGKSHGGSAEPREDIPAARLHFHDFQVAIVGGAEF